MPLADFLGWSSQDWTDTFGLLIVFGVGLPILIQGLLFVAAAQARGEKADDAKHGGRWGRRDDDAG